MTLRNRLVALAGAALGLPLSSCAAPPAPTAHRAAPPRTSPLHPLEATDEALATTTTEAPTTTTTEAPVTTVTINGLPAAGPSTTTTFTVPEAETEETDAAWWAAQPGYAEAAADFWYRLATCESENGRTSANQFQFMGGTAEKVGYYAGASYGAQRAMAQEWAARLRAEGTHPGSSAGWPECWFIAGGS